MILNIWKRFIDYIVKILNNTLDAIAWVKSVNVYITGCESGHSPSSWSSQNPQK